MLGILDADKKLNAAETLCTALADLEIHHGIPIKGCKSLLEFKQI